MKISKISSKSTAMLLIYAIVIVGSIIYFVYMQQFGTQGLEFRIEGSDNIFTIFDVLILILLPIAFVLLVISTLAFFRKPNMKMFIVSVAFFFFAVKEAIVLLENVFPKEFIFIENAERAIDFLILLSFIFLLYRK